MNFLAILHVPYEGPGLIEEWISLQHHHLEKVFAWEINNLGSNFNFDALIIMGGPMGVNDEEKYPWISQEKAFIRKAIDDDKKLLGICLGAQMLANCLGAKVFRNPEPEIGWFPIRKKFFMHSWFPAFDETEYLQVFHWHGDTFELPEESLHLFESQGCINQAFAVGDNILGLQFHPEINDTLLSEFLKNGRNELRPARYIQSESRMVSNYALNAEASRNLLFDLLDDFFTE